MKIRKMLEVEPATRPRRGLALQAALLLSSSLVCTGLLCTGVPLCGAVGEGTAAADEVSVPVELQVALLERIVRYERTFAAESTPVHVLVVSRAGSAESQRVSGQLLSGIRRAGSLGGRSVEVSAVSYTTAAALRAEVGTSHARIVYLAAALGEEIERITTALAGTGVITVSAVGADVDRGAVVGFELVSTRPRIIVNLTVARSHQLQFNAQFLRLARVVE